MQRWETTSPIFWDLESTGTLSPADSPSDILSSYFKSSAMCQQDGSYKVKFPWKNYHPPLPPNRAICEKRARSLARKLGHTPDLLKTYGEIISDQVKCGFIEKVTESEIPHNCHLFLSLTTLSRRILPLLLLELYMTAAGASLQTTLASTIAFRLDHPS